MTLTALWLAAVAPISATDVGVYAARTLIIVAVLVVGFRVLGKREMAQLNIYDLAMLIALSNAVQNAMTGGRGNLAVGLATSATILVGAWALTRVVRSRPAVERRLIGWPTVIIHDGTVLQSRLRRERVTPDELEEVLRAHGLASPSEVRLAVLEVDGSISVVPADKPPIADVGPQSPRRGRRARGARPTR